MNLYTEATIAWCKNRELLAIQRDCVCGCDCRVVKKTRCPGKFYSVTQ